MMPSNSRMCSIATLWLERNQTRQISQRGKLCPCTCVTWLVIFYHFVCIMHRIVNSISSTHCKFFARLFWRPPFPTHHPSLNSQENAALHLSPTILNTAHLHPTLLLLLLSLAPSFPSRYMSTQRPHSH